MKAFYFFNWFNIQLILALLLIIGSMPSLALASEIKSLYEIEVPVESQGNRHEDKALLKQALKEVVIRLRGSEKVMSVPSISNALIEPDKYVNQFSYLQRSPTQRILKIRFSESRLQELFKTAEQPIWGKNRPLTVIWATLKDDKASHWVNPEFEKEAFLQLDVTAKQLGIPVVFPLFDLSDTDIVSEEDISNAHLEPIQTATKRYGAEAVLVGRITKETQNKWQGHWTFHQDGKSMTWNTQQSDLKTLLTETVDNLGLYLSGQKTEEVTAVSKDFSITVQGIKDSDHYTRVLEHLRQMPFVAQVEVTQVMANQTVFNIRTTVDRETLVKSLATDSILTAEASTVEPGSGTDLIYTIKEVF